METAMVLKMGSLRSIRAGSGPSRGRFLELLDRSESEKLFLCFFYNCISK